MEFRDRDKSVLSQLGFDVEDLIGSGANVYVYRGICNERAIKIHKIDANNWTEESLNRIEFAVKFFDLRDEAQRAEAKLMTELKHPNVVEVLFVVNIKDQRNYVFMELLDIGSLKELITDIKKGGLKFNFRFFTDNQTLNFIMHLTSGLKYLHNKRLTHGDIHLGNVLIFSKIDNSRNLVAKWTDFGLSQNFDTTKDDLLKLGRLFMDISSYTEYENYDLGDAIDQMRQKLTNGEFEELNQLIKSYPIVYRMLAIE